jgi:hypothetical protein
VLYSSLEVPMLLLPLVAWAFRTRGGVPLPVRVRRGSSTSANGDSELIAATRNDVDNPASEDVST